MEQVVLEMGSGPNQMQVISDDIRKIRFQNGAYAISRLDPKTSEILRVSLNEGGPLGIEFDYNPRRSRASLSLDCNLWLFSQKYPDQFRKQYGDPGIAARIARPPQGDILLRFSGTDSLKQPMQASRDAKWRVDPALHQIGNRRCRKYVLENSRPGSTSACWVAVDVPVIVQTLRSRPDPRGFVRKRMTITELEFGRPVPKETFMLPRGTTCAYPEVYEIQLPPGVIAKPKPGTGLRF